MHPSIALLFLFILACRSEWTPEVPEIPSNASTLEWFQSEDLCANVSWVPRPISPRNLTLLYTPEDESAAEWLKCVLLKFVETVSVNDEVLLKAEAVNGSDACKKLFEKTHPFGPINMAILVSSVVEERCNHSDGYTRANVVQILKEKDAWKAQIDGVTSSMRLQLDAEEGTPTRSDLLRLMEMAIAMWRPRVNFDQFPGRYKTLTGDDQEIITDTFTWHTGVIIGASIGVLVLLVILIVVAVVVRRKIRLQRENELRLRAAMNQSKERTPWLAAPSSESEPGFESGEEEPSH